MNMSKTKLIAVAIVAIMAVTGTGLYFVLGDNDGYRSDDDFGRLMVYGNANNDDYIDQEDVAMLERIIAGEAEATRYADANRDGKIDQEDIDMVMKMIEKERMDIYYDYPYMGEILQGKVSYPVESLCVVGTNVMSAIKSIGAVDEILCTSGGAMDATLYSDIAGLPKVSTSTFDANMEEVSKYDVKAIVTQDSGAYLSNHDEFRKAGIDVIRISASDGIDSVSGFITLGYLLNRESRANDYAEFCDGIIEDLVSKVGAGMLEDGDRVTTLSVTMSNYVGGMTSDYYAASLMAGAINLADWDKTTRQFNLGDEWLLEEKYQSDFIIHSRSIGYAAFGEDDLKRTWNLYSQYFTEMDAYKDGNYIILNANMPVPLRLAYMASVFYPDIFGSDYGERMHQIFIDSFVDNLSDIGYDVKEDGVFLITKDMIGE